MSLGLYLSLYMKMNHSIKKKTKYETSRNDTCDLG